MASLIHEIENNEALLLMYLTGELPAEDCIEVEQLLARDGGLRAELERIRSAYDGALGALAKLDSGRAQLAAENHAIRQAMRAMKQWQVDRLARKPVVIAPQRLRIRPWMYPVGSVAALLIGTIAWWGFGGQFHFYTTPASSGTEQAILPPSAEEMTASRLDSSLSGETPVADPGSTISDAERQANSLVSRNIGQTIEPHDLLAASFASYNSTESP